MRAVGALARRAVVPVALLVAGACGGARPPEPPAPRAFALAANTGWLHGPCLAIRRGDLAKGTAVAAVIMAEPQRVERARIDARTDSPRLCPALLPGRAQRNARPGVFFYALDAGGIGPTDMGIGLVDPPADPRIVNDRARADLDRDGRDEVFTSCARTEGIEFAVWTGTAYGGEPRWSAYYYLDYESRPTCP